MTATGWQPIETAPRDGTEIDVWVRCFAIGAAGIVAAEEVGRRVNVTWGVQREVYTNPYEVREGDVEGWTHSDGLHRLLIEVGGYRVTHWMPLPPAPEAA